MEKHLLLPKENRYHTNVFSYLTGRGIDKEIIRFCIETGRIYESAYHHNAVFVGMDQQGEPKYAAFRGINTDFIGEANGSDKNYSFSIPAALARFLKEHTDVKEIILHLDNDRTGRLATQAIQTVAPEKYHVKDQPPTKGKDCNDMLCLRLNLGLTRREKSKNQKNSRPWER